MRRAPIVLLSGLTAAAIATAAGIANAPASSQRRAQPRPTKTVTVTAPGPTTTVTSTVTETATQTVTATETVTAPGPTVTVTAPGSTTTVTAPGPTTTVTQTVTPTPTPTPTPTGCANPTTITEGEASSFFEPDGSEYLIHNNNWNDNYGGSHVITACNYDDWTLTANVPNHSDLAVEAYPNVHRDYNNVALSSITSARFAGVGPKCAGCIYNTAFDIWIGQGLTHELMIWTENWGQRPAGNQVGTVTIGGHNYEVWRSGSGDGGIFTYVSTPEQLSGSMPLGLFFADVQARGWTPTTTWQVDFGVETVDTNGTSQTFRFTDFYIND